eukprot:Selendium_serpulae@DN1560_c0_g1_i4.p1
MLLELLDKVGTLANNAATYLTYTTALAQDDVPYAPVFPSAFAAPTPAALPSQYFRTVESVSKNPTHLLKNIAQDVNAVNDALLNNPPFQTSPSDNQFRSSGPNAKTSKPGVVSKRYVCLTSHSKQKSEGTSSSQMSGNVETLVALIRDRMASIGDPVPHIAMLEQIGALVINLDENSRAGVTEINSILKTQSRFILDCSNNVLLTSLPHLYSEAPSEDALLAGKARQLQFGSIWGRVAEGIVNTIPRTPQDVYATERLQGYTTGGSLPYDTNNPAFTGTHSLSDTVNSLVGGDFSRSVYNGAKRAQVLMKEYDTLKQRDGSEASRLSHGIDTIAANLARDADVPTDIGGGYKRAESVEDENKDAEPKLPEVNPFDLSSLTPDTIKKHLDANGAESMQLLNAFIGTGFDAALQLMGSNQRNQVTGMSAAEANTTVSDILRKPASTMEELEAKRDALKNRTCNIGHKQGSAEQDEKGARLAVGVGLR